MTSSVVGRHPNGSCASCRVTVSRADALAAAAPAPPVELARLDPTRQHRPIRLEPLTDHLQPELVETAERAQIRAHEGSVNHVEVFRLGGVRTPIIGRPRPSPRHRRAERYTLVPGRAALPAPWCQAGYRSR